MGSEVSGSVEVDSCFGSVVVGILEIFLLSSFSLVVSKILFLEVVYSTISSLKVVGSFILIVDFKISGLEVVYPVVPIFAWVVSTFDVVSIFD